MTVKCADCGRDWEPRSPKALYCSPKCRKAAFRKRGGAQVVRLGTGGERLGDGETVETVGTVAATRAELEVSGRLNTYLGAAAMRLAERMDSSNALMGYAPLVKEYRATMLEALKGAPRAADALDELQMRREAKFASA